jgi:membrane-bound metal-dependent hydrolase YbcI (DUF457 family)
MPRRATHQLISGVVGGIYSLAKQSARLEQDPTAKLDLVHLGMCVVAAVVGGNLPDILEPACRSAGPNHRGACHSVAMGVAVLKCSDSAACATTGDEWAKDAIVCAGLGYVSHLVADMTTPKSLHLVCRGF